jgi:protoheme IX farnesyltransferase
VSTSVAVARRAAAADYLELTKPRITMTVVMTALVGYVMGARAPVNPGHLALALSGTALVAAGASALNMVFERRTDALMLRTRNRPVAAGRLRVAEAVAFAGVVTAAGLAVLHGWAAARGQIEPGAVVLFAILFLWQIPHFLAIASIYREDYARGGLPMLPVLDPAGGVTGRQAVANSLALSMVSVVPTIAGLAGRIYLAGAILLGVAFTSVAVWSAIRRTLASSRALFLASIVYLLALCTLLLVDRL